MEYLSGWGKPGLKVHSNPTGHLDNKFSNNLESQNLPWLQARISLQILILKATNNEPMSTPSFTVGCGQKGALPVTTPNRLWRGQGALSKSYISAARWESQPPEVSN